MSTVFVLMLTWHVAPVGDPGPRERPESELRDRLWREGREVGLGRDAIVNLIAPAQALADAEWKLKESERKSGRPFVGPRRTASEALHGLVAGRDDLRGLPFLEEHLTARDDVGRRVLLSVSQDSARAMDSGNPYNRSLNEPRIILAMTELFRSRTKLEGVQADLTPAVLEQVALPHPAATRSELVTALGMTASDGAVRTLARRAVFDLSPEVRERARTELAKFDPAKVRPIFLEALRYPWAPAADHAARALVGMKDTGALEALRKLADEPPPEEPYREGERWVRRDLARIDHLRNCALCHPVAAKASTSEACAPLQIPGKPFVVDSRGTPTRISTDVTYLRTDISTVYHLWTVGVSDWPSATRFDFVSYVRPLTDKECDEHLARPAAPPTYPQREAVRWAIRRLGG